MSDLQADLAQLVRLSLGGEGQDVRLFVARLVRKYRTESPKLAEQLNEYLKQQSPRGAAIRKAQPKSVSEALLPPTSTRCGTRGQLFEIVKMEERETWTARFLRDLPNPRFGVVLIDFDGVRF